MKVERENICDFIQEKDQEIWITTRFNVFLGDLLVLSFWCTDYEIDPKKNFVVFKSAEDYGDTLTLYISAIDYLEYVSEMPEYNFYIKEGK